MFFSLNINFNDCLVLPFMLSKDVTTGSSIDLPVMKEVKVILGFSVNFVICITKEMA